MKTQLTKTRNPKLAKLQKLFKYWEINNIILNAQ